MALIALAHLLAVMALAASPRLHHWVHPDADDDDHDCAVVLFLHGGGNVASGPLILPTPAGLAATVFLVSSRTVAFVPSVHSASRVFEHAPPARG